jgi:hypothetical protein
LGEQQGIGRDLRVVAGDKVELQSSPLVLIVLEKDFEDEGSEPGSGLIQRAILEFVADVILNGVDSDKDVGRGSGQRIFHVISVGLFGVLFFGVVVDFGVNKTFISQMIPMMV